MGLSRSLVATEHVLGLVLLIEFGTALTLVPVKAVTVETVLLATALATLPVVVVVVVPVLLVSMGSTSFLGDGALGAVVGTNCCFLDFGVLASGLSGGLAGALRLTWGLGLSGGLDLTRGDILGIGLVVSLGCSFVIRLSLVRRFVVFVLLLLGVPQVVPPLANVEATSGERWRGSGISRGGGTRNGGCGLSSSGGDSRASSLGGGSILSNFSVLVVVVLLVVLSVFAVLLVVFPVLAVLPVFTVLGLSFGGSRGSTRSSSQVSWRSGEPAGGCCGYNSSVNGGSGHGGLSADNKVLEAIIVHAGLKVVVGVVTLHQVVLSVGHGKSPDNGAGGNAGNESDSGLGRHSY